MEVLVFDGKNYVKASKAARDLGYATDYVGQLCRSGKVDAHLIGRTWYVDQEMLSSHKVEKKRVSRVKAREYAKKTREEFKVNIEKAQVEKSERKLQISYESDTEDLIPETRKLTISTIRTKSSDHEDAPIYSNTLINAGKKVIMQGEVHVTDVNDDAIDEDTTVLYPGRIHKGLKEMEVASTDVDTQDVLIQKQADDEALETSIHKEEFSQPTEVAEMHKTFAERLQLKEVEQNSIQKVATHEIQQRAEQFEYRGPRFATFFIILFTTFLSLGSIFLDSQSTYSKDHKDKSNYSITVELEKTKLKIMSILNNY